MRFSAALAISVGFHALLGVVGVFYLDEGTELDSVVQLDLSSVELSFAEKEAESAPVAPPVVETPPPTPPPPPKEEEKKVEEKKEEEPPKPIEEEVKEPEPQPPEKAEEAPPPPPPPPPPPEKPRVEPPPKPAAKPVETPTPTPPPQPVAPPPAAPRQAAVVDAPARPRHPIKPDYPRGARARGEQGEVELEIEVGANGRVTSAKVVHSSGYPDLDGAALAAARSARFQPAKLKRKSVASLARLKLVFKLK